MSHSSFGENVQDMSRIDCYSGSKELWPKDSGLGLVFGIACTWYGGTCLHMPRNKKSEVGEPQVQGYPQLHNKLEASTGGSRKHSQNECKSKPGPL